MAQYAKGLLSSSGGSGSGGDVTGPGSSTDNAVARFDGTGGTTIQNSSLIVDDSGNTTTPGEITAKLGTSAEIPLALSTNRSATTGLLTGGSLSINADPAKFDVASGTGVIVDKWTDPANPTYEAISWNAFSAQTVTNLATENITGIGINSSGAIVQFGVDDFDTAKRDYIMLGFLIHPNHTSINSVNNAGTNVAYDSAELALDLALAVGSINLTGNVYSANGANLNINKSAGTAFSVGVNVKTSKKYPNTVTSPSQTAPTFFYSYRNGSGGYSTTTTTNINPDQYDDGTGVLATVNNNKWTIQYIWAAENFTVVEYGQNVYDTEAEAINAIRSEAHSSNPDLATLLLRAYLVVKKGTTALNNTANAIFVEAGRFGGGTSSSATTSTTTLQQAYNNSVTPEILTDSTRGALSVQRGSAADTDTVFEGQNGAGSVTFSVTGAGVVTGTLTNCTGLPISTGVSGLGTGVATFLATPSSANLAAAVTGETGSGALVFGTSPTLATPTIGTSIALTGSTSGTVTFKPQATAGTWTMELPTSAGSSGQFLQTNGSGTTTWATAGTPTVSSQAGNFTAATNTIYLVSSAAARNITLPAASSGLIFWVKDSTGSCETNNFTIVRAGSESIDGVAANKTLQTNWGSWTFVSDGTNWFIL